MDIQSSGFCIRHAIPADPFDAISFAIKKERTLGITALALMKKSTCYS
jgi:hypothetical protein